MGTAGVFYCSGLAYLHVRNEPLLGLFPKLFRLGICMFGHRLFWKTLLEDVLCGVQVRNDPFFEIQLLVVWDLPTDAFYTCRANLWLVDLWSTCHL